MLTLNYIIAFVNNNDIELSATQTRLSFPIINRLYKKMKANIKLPAIKVVDNFICDGHHRYIAALLANYPLEKTTWLDNTATNYVCWTAIEFDEQDWDSEAEILQFNRIDAQYNNITFEKMIELLR